MKSERHRLSEDIIKEMAQKKPDIKKIDILNAKYQKLNGKIRKGKNER